MAYFDQASCIYDVAAILLSRLMDLDFQYETVILRNEDDCITYQRELSRLMDSNRYLPINSHEASSKETQFLYRAEVEQYLELHPGLWNVSSFHVALLLLIDAELARIVRRHSMAEGIQALNFLHADRLVILPKATGLIHDWINPSTANHREYLRFRHTPIPLNALFYHMMFVPRSIFDKTEVYVHPQTKKCYYDYLKKKNEIQIGYVPFLPKSVDQYFNLLPVSNKFQIVGVRFPTILKETGLDTEQYLEQRYFDSLESILRQDPFVVLFPEMVLTNRIVQNMPSKIRQIVHRLQIDHPLLIVAGTLWDQHQNVCYVFDRDGNLVIRQNKTYAFTFEAHGVEYKEDLHFSRLFPYRYHILDIDKVGRFVFPICKDLLHEPTNHLFNQLEIDVELVPMYSRSYEVFRNARNFAINNHALLSWVNVCSQSVQKNHACAGFVLPMTNPDGGSETMNEDHAYPFPEHCIECRAAHCPGFVRSIPFQRP